jgi:hypothetical protein
MQLIEAFVFASDNANLGKYFTSSLVSPDGHHAVVRWPLALAQKRARVLKTRIPDLRLWKKDETAQQAPPFNAPTADATVS